MYLDGCELSLNVLLDVEVLVKFEAQRFAARMRTQFDTFRRTGVVPILFFAYAFERGVCDQESLGWPPLSRREVRCVGQQLCVRPLIAEFAFEMDGDAHA